MALSSTEWLSSIRTEDCVSSLLIVTDRGALSLTTVSRNRSYFGASLTVSHWKSGGFRTNAGSKYDTVSSEVEESTPLKFVEEYLLSGYGWNVRDLNPKKQKDLQDVAMIQAEAFHTPSFIFNDFFYDIFKAEVLTALSYKVRLSPPRRYTCLVVESEEDNKMVGVVDLTALDDKEVLQHLDEADEYLYVSGLAVDTNYRRRKVATALLKGVDVRAYEWGFKHLVLHAHEDDVAARRTYEKSGYEVVALDPLWRSTWIGRKRRVIMTKRVPFPVDTQHRCECMNTING